MSENKCLIPRKQRRAEAKEHGVDFIPLDHHVGQGERIKHSLIQNPDETDLATPYIVQRTRLAPAPEYLMQSV